MAGLDLRGVRATVEGWLVDRIHIARDNGNADDVLDEETGRLVPSATIDVYGGVGAVQPISEYSRMNDPDVARYYEESGARYRALLPLHAPTDIRAGDLLEVLEIVDQSSDPLLLGRTWQVVDRPSGSSFAVVRILYLKPV